MNYKFLSAFALVFSMYIDIKADQRPQATVQPQAATAQVAPAGLKIGFVDVGYILGMLPEAKKNSIEIQSFQKQLDNQIQTKINLFKEKADAFHQQLATLTDAQKMQKTKELQGLEIEINELHQQKEVKMQEKYRTVMQPLHDKMQEVVNKIAAEHKYTFIFNKNTDAGPVILFGQKEFDISDLVLEKLKEMTPKALPIPVVGSQQPSAKKSAPAKPGKKK
ncbi:MAG: OmpH family outer membrane protein [Candidatus Cardinium sp.]|uniref:OmpH family outer membrane protein n=1 Tax=Cardinium endosymbiont of Dermatophagoides farinae TaxID=2597823 RepID=UPI001183087A|nr:OmpH family outer membrane protein [Cardinium endosymbiont of Dermatophagoides farinae]TSJ81218.1 OmpH family outer membrane protein [Cardinium endosymbiont of Dermatophagoides farinae]UWW97268.1 MAG: OmpH family outer membrane protein [Candidatus Cardinium sp.]